MKRIIFTVVLLFISLCLWGLFSYQTSNNASYITDKNSPVLFVVERGETLNQVIEKLAVKEVVNAFWFKLLVKFEGAENRIQAGEYEFISGTTPVQILQFMKKGKVNQHKLSIIEGHTFLQLIHHIQQHPAIKKTLPENAPLLQYASLLNLPDKNLEGRLMPETYFFVRGTSDAEILQRAYRDMQTFLQDVWATREVNEYIKTPYEALILASIVERETAVASERKPIAGLFLQRLKIGMKLQTDPTVIYGMGDTYKGDIRFRDLRKDTPYNTYTRYGLPPTPIAMPGKASIDAVLHPEKSKSLYFVSQGNGTHVFSETLVQHNAAVDEFQRKKKK
jgi:UPF0755 protein